MINHFAADGSVKRQWPEGLHSSIFERDGKTVAQIQGSNAVGTVELEAGDQVGETFVPTTSLQSQSVPIVEPAAEPAAAPVEISTTEVAALNDAIHTIQDVAAHLAHPHPEHGDTIAQAVAEQAETHAEPVAIAPEPAQQ
jgi:hypothetical protein